VVEVGMTSAEIMRLVPAVYYSEREEALISRDHPGIAMYFRDVDPPPAIVPGLEVTHIEVFAKEYWNGMILLPL
jgi:hypothetical protein